MKLRKWKEKGVPQKISTQLLLVQGLCLALWELKQWHHPCLCGAPVHSVQRALHPGLRWGHPVRLGTEMMRSRKLKGGLQRECAGEVTWVDRLSARIQ